MDIYNSRFVCDHPELQKKTHMPASSKKQNHRLSPHRRRHRSSSKYFPIKRAKLTAGSILLWALLTASSALAVDVAPSADHFMADIREMAAFGDRSTGTPGCAAAAKFIMRRFEQLGLEAVGSQLFRVPVIRHFGSRLDLPERRISIDVQPVLANAVTPQTIQKEGPSGTDYLCRTGRAETL